MSIAWNSLLAWAREEVAETVRSLPEDLRPSAEQLPVIYEPHPNQALLDDGWEPDLLGLFDGDPVDVGLGEIAPRPTRVFLFLENLWDFAEEDEEIYREEVRITYLHELGHFLGLDEEELEDRGLL